MDPFLVEAGLLFSAGGGWTCCKGVISTGFLFTLIWLEKFGSKVLSQNQTNTYELGKNVSMILKSDNSIFSIPFWQIERLYFYLVKSFLKFWLLLKNILDCFNLILIIEVDKTKSKLIKNESPVGKEKYLRILKRIFSK